MYNQDWLLCQLQDTLGHAPHCPSLQTIKPMGCHRNCLAALVPLRMFSLLAALGSLNDPRSRIISQRDGPGQVQIKRRAHICQWMTLQAPYD